MERMGEDGGGNIFQGSDGKDKRDGAFGKGAAVFGDIHGAGKKEKALHIKERQARKSLRAAWAC